MNRREFISWVGAGAIASSLPLAIAACSPETSEPQTSSESPTPEATPQADGFLTMGTVAALDTDGKLLNKDADVLVIRNPTNGELSAVNRVCPHASCKVDWDTNAKIFACPCHGSKFAADGKVTDGPAKKPLDSYEVKEDAGSILVKTA